MRVSEKIFFEIEGTGLFSELKIPGELKDEFKRNDFEKAAKKFAQDNLPFPDHQIKIISEDKYIEETQDSDYLKGDYESE